MPTQSASTRRLSLPLNRLELMAFPTRTKTTEPVICLSTANCSRAQVIGSIAGAPLPLPSYGTFGCPSERMMASFETDDEDGGFQLCEPETGDSQKGDSMGTAPNSTPRRLCMDCRLARAFFKTQHNHQLIKREKGFDKDRTLERVKASSACASS